MQIIDDGGVARQVAAPRQRTLLAALLLRANQPVPVDELADVVWNGAPPGGAAATVRAYVMRLRRALGPRAAKRIITRDPGYLVQLDPAELDVLLFEALCQQAGTAADEGNWDETSMAASRALALWRGAPLADVPSRSLRDSWIPHLEQVRIQAYEWRIEADLHRGRHEQLIPQLQALVAEHPLRERFHGQLMLALARCGRQADALAAYQSARRTLVDELGIEPGPELRGLHERILGWHVESAPAGAPPPAKDWPVPRQLPLTVRHFAGRVRELKVLSGMLEVSDRTGGMVVISAIDGTAGIGKTALAVHWAHEHADRFPDGQLYVNLRGFDPSGVPMRVEEAIRRFLDAMAVPAARVPADLDSQVDLYRSCLAGRQTLIVLDNARNAEQVRPLLPGAAGCLVMITSRNQLTGLVAVEGAHPLTLDLLTVDEAHQLLSRRLGTERVAREERAAAELAELCGRLPLALNIAAAHAVVHPDLPLAAVAGELRDARQRLDALTTNDTAGDVRAVFSWSYRALDSAIAPVFRLAGLASGPDLSLPAAAALLDQPVTRVGIALDTLVDANLLQNPKPGRYRYHDLLRVYAAEQAEIAERPADRDAAVRRLLVWYLGTAVAAARVVSPHRRLPSPETSGVRPASFSTYDDAVDWLDSEYANLVASVETAERHEWHVIVWQLAIALWDVCQLRGHYADLIATHELALASARRLADQDAEGWLLSHLSVAYSDTRRPDKAIDSLTRALVIDRRTGNRRSEAVNLVNLGYAFYARQQFEQAIQTFGEAASVARESGHWRAEAAALNDIGDAHLRLGRPDLALEFADRALAIYRAEGDRQGEAGALATAGEINRLLGNTEAAFRICAEGVALSRETGNRREEANALASLGYLRLAEGNGDQARQHWLDAETIFLDIGDPRAADLRAQIDLS